MSWEQFVQLATTILYWSLLWLLAAIPAAVLIYAIGRFAPNRPGDAANRMIAYRPGPSEATTRFRARRADARQHLSLGTVRIMLDRKHAKLKRELAQIRATIDRRLQQITRASRSTSGVSLMDLLVSFRDDTAKALEFDAIDDITVQKSVALARARTKFTVFIISITIVSLFNFGLLYLYFDEAFGGMTLPYVGIEFAILAAAFFPILESFGGLAFEAVKEKEDGPSAKFVKSLALGFSVLSLATFEYYIFYKLFEGGFRDQIDFPEGGLFHMAIAMVGPSLTIFQATCGYGIARELDRIKELGTVTSIASQVANAKKFVDGLDSRYDRIEEAAARASESIDEFAAQIKGRGEAEQPAVSLLAEERKRFIEAVDAVNPNRWKGEVAPSEGDIDAVTAYAWFLPIAVAFALAGFTLVFAPAVQASGLFPANLTAAVGISLLTGVVAVLAGGALFDRASSSVEGNLSWKDVLSPRDGAYKAFSVFALFTISVGIALICIAADGWIGVAEAALLIGIIAGICWASSYIDLMLRGLAYLGVVAWSAFIWLLSMAARLIWYAVLLLAIAIAATTLFVLHLVAFPMTWLASRFSRTSALPTAEISAA